jgi:hypothetical protein
MAGVLDEYSTLCYRCHVEDLPFMDLMHLLVLYNSNNRNRLTAATIF